jgi:uncharacterized phiE125 gp8 family phage protein
MGEGRQFPFNPRKRECFMTIALIVGPLAEPVTVSAVKAHLRLETADEDQLIADLIRSARNHVEQVSGLKLMTQTWRQYHDCYPDDHQLALQVNPLQQVVSITRYDGDGNPLVLPASDYDVDTVSVPGRIHFRSKPAIGAVQNGLEIDVVAGFGDTAVEVPDALKRAILMLAAHWYEFRGSFGAHEQPVSLPDGFNALMASFRRPNL